MTFLRLFLASGISLLFLVLAFVPMERVFPAKPGQKFFRPAWWLDLCFFLGQYFLWSGLVIWVLSYFNSWLQHILPGSFRHAVAAQPFWIQAIEVIVLSDLIIYWAAPAAAQS